MVGCGVVVVAVVLVVAVVDGGVVVVVGGSIGVDNDLPVYKCRVHYIFWSLGLGTKLQTYHLLCLMFFSQLFVFF